MCRDGVQALYDPKVGGLANGLTYKPWIEAGVAVKDSEGTPLSLQDKLEKKWNLSKGYLHNRPWRKGDSIKEENFSYYQRKSWKLNDGSTVLDTDNMDDELAYYMYLDSKFVANSEKEWREGKWPKATHYIALENEAEEIKFSRNETKSKAFASLHAEDMTPTVREKICSILELSNSRSFLSPEQSHNLLFEYIDKTTFGPRSNIEKFSEIANSLKTPKGREELEARFLLKKALDFRVIYERQGTYTWPKASGQIVLGENYGEAIDFVLNPKKQALLEELEAEIKAKSL